LLDFEQRREFSFDGWNDRRRLWVAAPMPDGRSVVCFYEAFHQGMEVDLAPEIRDVSTGRLLRRLHGPTFAWMATVAPSASWAASSSSQGIVTWDLTLGRAVGRLVGHNGRMINALAASATDRLLVSAGSDGTLRLWDIDQAIALDEAPSDVVKGLAVVDANLVVAVDNAGRQAAWTLDAGSPVSTGPLVLEDRWPRPSLEWAPSGDGSRAGHASWHTPTVGMFTWSEATGQDSYLPARLEVDSLPMGDCLAELEDPRGPLTALAMTFSGDRLLAASWDGTVSVWDVGTGALVHRLHIGAATARITLTPSGRTGGQMLDTLVVAEAAATALLVTADDHVIATTRNGSLQEWHLGSGELLAATILEAPPVAVRLGPDEETLLLADERGRITCLGRSS
jgi:WD40 repeat protein